jgi:hypothetical protein
MTRIGFLPNLERDLFPGHPEELAAQLGRQEERSGRQQPGARRMHNILVVYRLMVLGLGRQHRRAIGAQRRSAPVCAGSVPGRLLLLDGPLSPPSLRRFLLLVCCALWPWRGASCVYNAYSLNFLLRCRAVT